MDLLDVLRRQASRFQCPNCGKSLADCRLDVIARNELESLVRITCVHCTDSRLLAVAMGPGVVAGPVRDEPVVPEGPPIAVDEVLDLRLALQNHPGDLKSLLQPEQAS